MCVSSKSDLPLPQRMLPRDGSVLCFACGFCCSGVLHSNTVVKSDDIEHVCALGLTVETFNDHLGFRQPCPVYQAQCCLVYPNHPQTCRAYQCALLKKHLAGAITREQGAQTIQRTRELLTAVSEQMPAGYSLGELQRAMEQDWDSGRGPFGSTEDRLENAEFLLAVAKLERYLRKHFRKPKDKEKSDKIK